MLMKKLLLLAAGALMGLSASAQWAVVGSYSTPDWNFEASTQLEGTGDELTCTIEYLSTSFKIVDITNNNWDDAYGVSDADITLSINTPLQLTKGGDNIYFSGALTQGVNNATVKWNTSTYTVEVVAAESDIVADYPELYMTGSFNEWATPGESGSILGTRTGYYYAFNVDLGTSGSVTFKVASANWATEFAGAEDGVIVGEEPVTVVNKNTKDLTTNLTGEQTLVFDMNSMQMWFGEVPEMGDNGDGEGEGDGDNNAIHSINVNNAAPVYYNLNGVKVNNPDKGVYIIRQGNKTSKVVL